jgi:hypothetical protein
VITDSASPVKGPLDHGLSANEDRVAKLHCLWVSQNHTRLDLEIMTDRLAHGPHQNASHEPVEISLSGAELREQIEQHLTAAALSKPGREIAFPDGILTCLAPPKSRHNLPD